MITKTTDGLGTTTELWTNSNGGNIKLSAVQTITSIDGNSITINRDSTGGGWFNQTEVRTTYADGHRTLTITDKNADGRAATDVVRHKGPVDLCELRAHRAILRGAGSEIDQASTTVPVDGFTRSVGTDMDSDLLADRVFTDAMVNRYWRKSNEARVGESDNDNKVRNGWPNISQMQAA